VRGSRLCVYLGFGLTVVAHKSGVVVAGGWVGGRGKHHGTNIQVRPLWEMSLHSRFDAAVFSCGVGIHPHSHWFRLWKSVRQIVSLEFRFVSASSLFCFTVILRREWDRRGRCWSKGYIIWFRKFLYGWMVILRLVTVLFTNWSVRFDGSGCVCCCRHSSLECIMQSFDLQPLSLNTAYLHCALESLREWSLSSLIMQWKIHP
jgi:hypothetical protein